MKSEIFSVCFTFKYLALVIILVFIVMENKRVERQGHQT